jgi:uncharacterized protein (TIGR02145 family)
MKFLTPLFIIFTISYSLFPQSLIIYKNGGLKDTVDVAVTDSILVAPFQCGVNKLRYADKIYNTIQIGTQCWLKGNLDVGTRIDLIQDQSNNGIIEKYCYNNDSANCAVYGGMYQWAEAVKYQNGTTNSVSPDPAFTGNIQGICPGGWHIPTVAEFGILAETVGNSGNALKQEEQGDPGPLGTGTNSSGFSGLLSGSRGPDGACANVGKYAPFWSSTDSYGIYGNSMNLSYNDNIILFYQHDKINGFSVRCLKD